MRRAIGVNSWVWVSPVTDRNLPEVAATAARLGFEAIELPVESPGDWSPSAARTLLAEHALAPYVVGAMAPGRDLLLDEHRAATQGYLKHCIDVAVELGAHLVAGPFYAATGRTWRMDAAEREAEYDRLRHALDPVVDHAADAGVALGIEPLNRYETSLINTVQQGLDALGPLLSPALGLALDSYHLNIEEKDIAVALRAAGRHLLHVQVCGNDRGAVGDDHLDWRGFLAALDEVGYAGPLNLESFTAHNDTIATAASIWRPLAESQDALAERSIRYLTALQEESAA